MWLPRVKTNSARMKMPSRASIEEAMSTPVP